MNIQRVPIISASDPASPLPWYEFAINDTEIVITRANHRGAEALGVVGQKVALADVTGQDTIILLTLDDEMVLLHEGTSAAIAERNVAARGPGKATEHQAHLGWYDKTADTLTLLEFVEPGG